MDGTRFMKCVQPGSGPFGACELQLMNEDSCPRPADKVVFIYGTTSRYDIDGPDAYVPACARCASRYGELKDEFYVYSTLPDDDAAVWGVHGS